MTHRSGSVGFGLLEGIVVVELVAIVATVAAHSGIVTSQIDNQVETVYTDTVIGEQVISAPCATISRGIFYRSAVRSGQFSCITPQNEIYIRFELEDSTYRWRIKRVRDGRAVDWITNPRPILFTQRYVVLIYDPATGETTPAVLGVGGG